MKIISPEQRRATRAARQARYRAKLKEDRAMETRLGLPPNSIPRVSPSQSRPGWDPADFGPWNITRDGKLWHCQNCYDSWKVRRAEERTETDDE